MSMTREPGVSAIVLASAGRPIIDLSRVRTLTMPGLMWMRGE